MREVQLIDYVQVLFRQRLLIAAVLVVGLLLGLVATLVMPREYDATVSLLVSVPKVGDLNTVEPSMPTYRALILNGGIARDVVTSFNLGAPPYSFSWKDFLDDHVAVRPIVDTNIVEVTVSMGDAQLAADLANDLATRTVELNKTLMQNEYVQSRDEIKQQLDATGDELEKLGGDLLAFRKSAKIEMLEADARSLLTERDEIRTLAVDIETERARLDGAESEIDKHEPLLTVNRAIDSDVAALEAARQVGTGSTNPLNLELRDEMINPVYESLQQQIATTRTTLAALERRRQELVGTEGEKAVRDVHDALYQARAELEALELDFDLTRTQYSQLAARYDQAQLQVLLRSATLQMIDQAVPPARAARPRMQRNLLTGLVIALVLILPAAVIRDEFQVRRPTA